MLDDELYDDDVYDDDLTQLSAHDMEALVDELLATRQRAEELESENAKLTQQLMDVTQGNAPDTLVIHVSPEMW